MQNLGGIDFNENHSLKYWFVAKWKAVFMQLTMALAISIVSQNANKIFSVLLWVCVCMNVYTCTCVNIHTGDDRIFLITDGRTAESAT